MPLKRQGHEGPQHTHETPSTQGRWPASSRQDSVVSITNRYGLDGPWIKPRWGKEMFSCPYSPRPALGPTESLQWVFPGAEAPEAPLTSHPFLAPRLRMSRAVHVPAICHGWPLSVTTPRPEDGKVRVVRYYSQCHDTLATTRPNCLLTCRTDAPNCGDCEECSIFECNAVYFGRNLQTFLHNVRKYVPDYTVSPYRRYNF